MDKVNVIIGMLIKLARIEKGWSQLTLAKMSGLKSAAGIRNIEKGKVTPRWSSLMSIVRALDGSMKYQHINTQTMEVSLKNISAKDFVFFYLSLKDNIEKIQASTAFPVGHNMPRTNLN